jgi:hypothetical protein
VNEDEWQEATYQRILEEMGKPISSTSNGRLVYNCPICGKPKFYLYPHVGYCHHCGKTFLMKELRDILGLEIQSAHIPRVAKLNFFEQRKTKGFTYCTDPLINSFVYQLLYIHLDPPTHKVFPEAGTNRYLSLINLKYMYSALMIREWEKGPLVIPYICDKYSLDSFNALVNSLYNKTLFLVLV